MNSEEKQPSLFNDFMPVSAAEWATKIEKDLKGTNLQTLHWETYEGITVKPFYTTEDIAVLPLSDTWPGQFPYIRGHKTSTNNWLNLQEICLNSDSQAAIDTAVQALAAGADGIHFKFENGNTFDFEYALANLDVQKAAICFSLTSQPAQFLK